MDISWLAAVFLIQAPHSAPEKLVPATSSLSLQINDDVGPGTRCVAVAVDPPTSALLCTWAEIEGAAPFSVNFSLISMTTKIRCSWSLEMHQLAEILGGVPDTSELPQALRLLRAVSLDSGRAIAFFSQDNGKVFLLSPSGDFGVLHGLDLVDELFADGERGLISVSYQRISRVLVNLADRSASMVVQIGLPSSWSHRDEGNWVAHQWSVARDRTLVGALFHPNAEWSSRLIIADLELEAVSEFKCKVIGWQWLAYGAAQLIEGASAECSRIVIYEGRVAHQGLRRHVIEVNEHGMCSEKNVTAFDVSVGVGFRLRHCGLSSLMVQPIGQAGPAALSYRLVHGIDLWAQ
jgi:hypothetical protein